jgi:ferredoxin, 2Fe-2S
MVRIVFVQSTGEQFDADAKRGLNLMQIAADAQIPGILGECGGSLACGTCHVYVQEDRLGDLSAMTVSENEMLEFTSSERRVNSRLACQVEVSEALEGLKVTVPESQI